MNLGVRVGIFFVHITLMAIAKSVLTNIPVRSSMELSMPPPRLDWARIWREFEAWQEDTEGPLADYLHLPLKRKLQRLVEAQRREGGG